MSLCGGQHQSKFWTSEEIKNHIKEPCVDCFCGIDFKQRSKK